MVQLQTKQADSENYDEKENKKPLTVMTPPPKKRPSNLPATVTVIATPLQHLIEILILWFDL